MEKVLAWHFVGNTLRDGRPIPADGELLKFDNTPILCQRGLHASLHPYDALNYAPGPILCRVECSGTIIRGDDKLVCTERTIIARADATEAMRYFARYQALSAIDNWQQEPPEVVLEYLMTGDEQARSAARSAAWSAAWSAAESAAWSAAESAAWSAARSAARSAAWSAAWSAARSAARSAAWSAAWSAARSAAREMWLALCEEAFK